MKNNDFEYEYDDIRLDKLNEECGVFGIYSNDNLDVVKSVYYGLYALQHRGQESCGVAVNNNGEISYYKDMGLVPEVFTEHILNCFTGKMAIGHTRYSTTGSSLRENAQPMVINYKEGKLALAHNGNLVNAAQIRIEAESQGAIFQTSTDTEVMASLISRYRVKSDNMLDALKNMMKTVQGGYALVILTPRRLVGIRDPFGIRPLCIGKLNNSFVLASESCALDAVGAEYIRDLSPGEIVFIGDNGIESYQSDLPGGSKLCVFEHIYFARPDSVMDGASVYESRLEAGKRLAIEHPVEADLVIGVPDSGLTAALGYSRQSGIPYGEGLIKNRYIGRTFIQPEQGQREAAVKIKLNPLKQAIRGKRIVMIDDSIVRGTTSRRIVQMLKEAGAKEVHMRVSSPPIKYSCHYGIDTPSRNNLVAATCTVDEICKLVSADSLGFLSVDALVNTPKGSKCGFCTACLDGDYPIDVPEEGNKFSIEQKC